MITTIKKYICKNCKITVFIENINPRKINKKHHLFCKKCIKQIQLCSRYKCKYQFLLNDNDMKDIKYIYIDNKNNNTKYYVYNDIKHLILSKYKSFDNLNTIIKNKKIKMQQKLKNTENSINNRKSKLITALNNNKLEYKKYGDCYSYVHYGKPSIETIIKNELNKIHNQTKKKILLAKELTKIGIPFDETLKACYEFIHNIGYKSLNEIIREIEIEYFFKHHTIYISLLDKFDEDTAKELAIRDYFNKHNKSEENNSIIKKIHISPTVINFD